MKGFFKAVWWLIKLPFIIIAKFFLIIQALFISIRFFAVAIMMIIGFICLIPPMTPAGILILILAYIIKPSEKEEEKIKSKLKR